MGWVVENARAKPWGVLVIDTRQPNLNVQLAQQQFAQYSGVLARLVRGV